MPVKKSAVNVRLGEAMRSARQARGYSQESFAAHAGIDRSYYGALERGEFNPTMDTVAKVAVALQDRLEVRQYSLITQCLECPMSLTCALALDLMVLFAAFEREYELDPIAISADRLNADPVGFFGEDLQEAAQRPA